MFEWITSVIGRLGYSGLGRLVPGVRTFVSVPAGFARMPLTSFLLFSALGTVLWTTALACADMVTDVVPGVMGVIVARRYVNCWKASSDTAGCGQGRVHAKIEKASS
jgi:uncharacterized membrane protein YdjX (TVP38/TMEM64 family)